MFGDDRPTRFYQEIWIANPDDGAYACARCSTRIDASDVAMYTRTRPGHPFDPWCAECAYILVRWAGAGALSTNAFDTPRARELMEALIRRGSY
jgi:hypothetical protein